jgi:hypothetical protein
VVGGCTLGGDIVIDNTADTFISANVTMAGETPSVGPFTMHLLGPVPIFGITEINADDSVGSSLGLFFPTPTSGSLVGYTGGPLNIGTGVILQPADTFAFDLDSGSLTERTPVSVPEPASWILVTSALLGFGIVRHRNRHA